MLTAKELRERASDIAAEAIVGISDFFNKRRGCVWGIVAVTLGSNTLYGLDHPLPLVAFLSIPASVICGRIAFRRGARGLGGTAIALGIFGFLLNVFILVTYLFMLAG